MVWLLPLDATRASGTTAYLPLVIVLLLALVVGTLVVVVLRRMRR